MSQLAKNIKHLRKQKGLSQADFGNLFSWTRAAVSSYEDGRATPPYEKLKAMADYFELTLEELNGENLKSPTNESHATPAIVAPQQQVGLFTKPLNPSLNPKVDGHYQLEQVEMVPKGMKYHELFDSPQGLLSLPTMTLPLYQKGSYIAFEGRSESPHEGWFICRKISNWFDIEDQKHFFLVSKNQGIFHRKVFNEVRAKGTLILSGLVADVETVDIPISEVDEIWQVVGQISFGTPKENPDTTNAQDLLQKLARELKRF